MSPFGRNVAQRNKYESAFRQARMRKRRRSICDAPVIINNIKIK